MRMPGRWLAWDSVGCVPEPAVAAVLGGLVTGTGGVDVVAAGEVVVGGFATIPLTL